ncbi:MAG TPA: 3-keto-5-aminohexanoate cleavage protein [Myxococcota bacterium]|nr:3-keto-5-aminohexanoate cleavage protein [Myxococcales bacterium]HPG28441.1 3-keto-5-aminohexanoate cleavage protein [Myxococcota bacterium]
MSLVDEGKVMVRVAINEFRTKSENPHVPYDAEEIARAAIGSARAGASIIHYHSRHADGRQAQDDDRRGANVYRRAMELVARECDVLMEPTNLPHGTHDVSSIEDLPHLWALADDPPAIGRLEIVNLDAFRFQHLRSGWDVHAKRLVTIDETQTMRPDRPFRLPPGIEEALRRGFVPFFGVFNLSDVRLLAAYAGEGLIPTPVLVQINFFADLMWGPTPSIEALDAFLWEWRREPIDSEISVFVRGLPDFATYEYMVDAAFDRGISMRVGIGDNPAIFDGDNGAMVEHFVERAARRGFEPVTPDGLRKRVGIVN